jgi:hypothetical protein
MLVRSFNTSNGHFYWKGERHHIVMEIPEISVGGKEHPLFWML